MAIPHPTTLDFETFGIEGRPDYPPVPVGVSIKQWGKAPRYYAWGHPSGNNCTKEDAYKALQRVRVDDELLFHNSNFDLDVLETHFNIGMPPWMCVHDTMFLLFLDDPHSAKLDLKSSAAKYLDMPPDERDVVADWLTKHQPVPDVKIGRALKGKEPPGKYIAYAPGEVVGPYANGDVVRTEALFNLLYPRIVERGMLEAYDRERKLVPILLQMERNGIRVDTDRLHKDVQNYQSVLVRLDNWLRDRLACGADVNLDSGPQLVEALRRAELVDTSKMGTTPKTGRVKTSQASIAVGVTDPAVAAVLKYNSQLQTCVRTFMEPWLATAGKSKGLIYTHWNQTRGDHGGGARTGRFSSSPNFQNIPKEFGEIAGLPFDLPPLPLCRGYIVPYAPGHVLVGRDYSQQEPRILAHFEDGALREQYNAEPWIDYHDNAKQDLERIFGRAFDRRSVKNINLGIIYGQGVTSLAARNGESYESTKQVRDAIYALYPDLRGMYDEMRRRARSNQPIRTWGGREYYVEPPQLVDNAVRTFDYKLVNVLVQGSAADCTKEGMIRFAAQMRPGWKMLLQVHDEIVISVPKKDLAVAQSMLRDAMESVEFDVSILSEGSWSESNWGGMRDFDKKGVMCPV